MIEITLILVLIFLVVFLTFATHESVTSFIKTKKLSKLKNSELDVIIAENKSKVEF